MTFPRGSRMCRLNDHPNYKNLMGIHCAGVVYNDFHFMDWLKQATASAPHFNYQIKVTYFEPIQGFFPVCVIKLVELIVQYVNIRNSIFISVWLRWILYVLQMNSLCFVDENAIDKIISFNIREGIRHWIPTAGGF